MNHYIIFAIGVFFGVFLGWFIAALFVAAGDADARVHPGAPKDRHAASGSISKEDEV